MVFCRTRLFGPMTWSSRIFHEPLPRDDRNRDIFPLPLLAGPRDGRVGACRAVARRVARRRRITEQVNMAILALNSMFFGGEGGGFQKTVSDVSSLPLCQRETIRSLVKDVQSFGAPPPSASRSGALVALRASSSGYGEPEAGVGDVVGIRLDRLSLPSGRVAGVDLGESLEDPLRTMVTDYESWMLKDADEWQSISDEAVRFKCYDDPILADRRSYLDFLRHLHRCGILGLTDGVQGRVGVFAVSKKPKVENGVIKERQRLILDCRGVNMRFKDPPRSELGSLAALTELELPDGQNLFVAGADIQDCFYAAKLPGDLQSFFCLAHDLDRDEACNIFGDDFVQHSDLQSFSPCINVLPMGFSWSFYIIQQLHEQSVRRSLGIPREDVILDGYPAPQLSGDKVVAMPYCDNCHSLALSAEGCEEGKKRMCEDLEGMGFSLHEQVGATEIFPTLGGVIDGVDGSIRPTSTRAWNILYAFEYLLDHRVEYKVVQRLLGHAMFLCVLHRGGMSIFRHLYDFVEARGEPRFLNNSEKREVKNFIGVVPLLYGSLRRPWSTTVTATDASPEGFGICERELPESDIRHVGRWQEKWRFRHLPPELWRPRQRAMQGQDVFSNIDTARGGVVEQELEDIFWEDPNFPEVPHKIMSPSSWKTVKFGKWKNTNESITIKEGRALVLAVRRLCRSSGSRHKRHLFFVDNLSLAFSVGKGRASNYSLLRINQQLSALTLAGHFTLRVRWVASELNVADGPSRGQLKPGAYQACASSKGPTEADLSYIDPKGGAESRDEELSSPSTSKILEGGITEGGEEECSPSTQGVLKTECREDSETNHREDGDRSERGGAVGSQKAIDFSGAEINFFGRGRSVQGVLQEVREFLPGVKASKPTSSTNGQSYGRFHGHPFHGRKDSERGRKNLGKRGVQAHRVEGQHVEKQKGLEGMEKRKTSGESLTHSCFGGEWHCNDPSPPESAVDGSQGPSRFRHLHEARRKHRHQSSTSGAASGGGWSPISLVSCGHPRISRRSTRQDRSFRQQCGLGPSPAFLVGRGTFRSLKNRELQGRLSFSVQDGGVSTCFFNGRRKFRNQRLAPVPVEAWGGGGGLELENSRVLVSQGERKVDDRSECSKIHQSGKTSSIDDTVVARQSGVLSLVSAKHGESDPRFDSSQRSMNAFQQDVFADISLPRRFSLELFAGTARIAKEMCRKGFNTYPIDICLYEHHNVLDTNIEHCIFNWVRGGRIRFIWMGMPCTSFSRARKWDGMGPGPLRSDTCLWGLPSLSNNDQRKVDIGNRILLFTVRLLRLCEQHGVPYVLENPSSSRAWLMPPLRAFADRYSPFFVELDYCQYNEPWKKPTTLMYNFLDLSSLHRKCNTVKGVCSHTHRQHIVLAGRDSSGQYLTLRAQPYPHALVTAFGHLVAGALGGDKGG